MFPLRLRSTEFLKVKGSRCLDMFHQPFSGKTTVAGKKPPDFTPLAIGNVENWVAKLGPVERELLTSALQKHQNPQLISDRADLGDIPPVSTKQLFHVGTHYALPFVGFGFLDNFIMIIAGDYIDLKIGTMLGISTMAAAALGNAVSDVCGIGSAWYVESLTSKLGVPQPNLSPIQLTARSVTWAINIGRALGVAIGCILGMIPLLFISGKDKHKGKAQEKSGE